ncbi:peptidase inhibitor family I36 protein [Streptomyces sp. MUM 203J]|uniref:peptidase inhibitor family I36 protein n=1 Tax=Streptomyces sp. MUM 203J TaxID=2791990 RepID=UPI001F039179|nr:peptidase inhibitor family I36 protein [Streptomyces sp. MUM 203J]MCH0541979.1 peptidase inhibitor family I36 protein [Streptomyces sp. MUM 203J]
MSWKMKAAASASMLTLTMSGTLMAAPTAAAAGNCPSGYLCVYDATKFSGNRIVSASTNSCFDPHAVVANWNYIRSYTNNNSVDAAVWHYSYADFTYKKVRTLPAGGFSSNIGIDGLGGQYGDKVCMGNARP